MTSTSTPVRSGTAEDTPDPRWRRNLLVALFGSFTTIVAMTSLLPYLPLYVEDLGVHGEGAVARWSGLAFAATFLTAGLTAPLWGRLGDRYGRKPMLIRASLGMAVTTAALGLVQNVEQLVAVRLLTGLVGGYASGSTILVAAQTPRERTAWALGVLSMGTMAGTVAGPLIGGWLPLVTGIRMTFMLAGALILVAFLATATLLVEQPRPAHDRGSRPAAVPLERRGTIVLLLAIGSMAMFATTAIEPILTLVVGGLDASSEHLSGLAGVVFTATALGSILSAPQLGRLADRHGHQVVIVGSLTTAALLALLQAQVSDLWQLVVLRFLMGVALGGLLPSVTAAVRALVPQQRIGRVLGLGVSAQYAGQVLGPLAGGLVAAHASPISVFTMTAVVLAVVALLSVVVARGARA